MTPAGSAAVPAVPVADPRLAAFCAPDGPEVFHSVVHQPQVWTPDPFDVESVHAGARETFERLLHRAALTPPPQYGTFLLLLGEAGSGKTHLILQMTAPASNYDGYTLGNLIDSLDLPYYAPAGTESGLMRLAVGLLESLPLVSAEERQQFREGYVPDLAARVEGYADQIVADPRFGGCLDLIRALLYLLRDDPPVKSRVLKWLRCEDLSDGDRRLLGGLVPRCQEEGPRRTLTELGHVMSAVQGVPLVLLVDQLEDVFLHDGALDRFRKVINTLVAVLDAVPTSVVVLACLEDYFTANRQQLSAPKLNRMERDPDPIRLSGKRTVQEIEAIIGQRLRALFENGEAGFDEQTPTFPFRCEHLEPLTNLQTRDVLDFCRQHRERCILLGRWVEPTGGGGGGGGGGVDLNLEQDWNAFRAGLTDPVPDEESELTGLLAWAARSCSAEVADGFHFGADADGRFLQVEAHTPGNGVSRLLVAVCERGAQGGGLGRQIDESLRRAGENHLVLVRSTAFPSNPNTAVSRQIADAVRRGGRRVVVENGDWRRLLAFRAFHGRRGAEAGFAAWQRDSRPLSQLPALRQILALDRVPAPRVRAGAAPSRPPAARSGIGLRRAGGRGRAGG
jgi:hypothetical protein